MPSKSILIQKKSTFSERWPLYLMITPFMICFFVFLIIPIFSSVILSFTSFDMIHKTEFVGIDNYMRMFVQDDVFPIVVRNTLLFSVVTGPLGFILSFVLAWFINEFSPRIRTVLSFLFYAPALVGNAYYIWEILFSGDSYGYLNSLLLSYGFTTEPIVWLKNSEYVLIIIMIVQLWQSMGVSFLANISGLQNVNNELYEAGSIDGIKNRWQELWYITLPTMKNILLFRAVMQIQSSFSVGTIAVQLAGYPSVDHSADTIVSFMTDVGTTRYEMGYASAIAVVLFLIMAILRVLIGKLLDLVGR